MFIRFIKLGCLVFYCFRSAVGGNLPAKNVLKSQNPVRKFVLSLKIS